MSEDGAAFGEEGDEERSVPAEGLRPGRPSSAIEAADGERHAQHVRDAEGPRYEGVDAERGGTVSAGRPGALVEVRQGAGDVVRLEDVQPVFVPREEDHGLL